MTGLWANCGLCALLLAVTTSANAATAKRTLFGNLEDGRAVEAVVLSNGKGLAATVIAYGATLQSLMMPDREGKIADVTLGYATIGDYVADPQYYGATVGRFANRVAGGRFVLDGRAYRLPINNGPNSLHGGTVGFDKVLWQIVSIESGPVASVTLRHVSPDGDQGYPGTLTVTATYRLDANDVLTIDYHAITDKPTIVNITNHAYWNLSGEGSPNQATNHLLTVIADQYLPIDENRIPLGACAKVDGTPFDFRKPTPIGARLRDATDVQIARGRGYDHNWVLANVSRPALRHVATLADPTSGRAFELWSNQAGLQVYSGNFLNGTSIGKSGRAYRQGDAVALEPQAFPDSPNQPGFTPVRLDRGMIYRNIIEYHFRRAGPQTTP